MPSRRDDQLLERIVLDPRIMAGKPIVRGTRLTVQYVLGLLAHGAQPSEILDEYPGLTEEDLRACLLFAAESLGSASFPPGHESLA